MKRLTLILIGMIPLLAAACPMCQGGPSEDTRLAYKVTTAFLASMPLILGAVIYFWISKRKKQES